MSLVRYECPMASLRHAAQQQRTDLERLRRQAEDLWEHQQEGIAKAKALAADAGRQGVDFTRRSVAPRVGRAYGSGVAALGSAVATLQALRDRQVRDALSTMSRVRLQSPIMVAPAPKKKSSAGLWIGLGISAIAAAAVGYVVWQTLRADDDLWIEDGDEAPDLSADL